MEPPKIDILYYETLCDVFLKKIESMTKGKASRLKTIESPDENPKIILRNVEKVEPYMYQMVKDVMGQECSLIAETLTYYDRSRNGIIESFVVRIEVQYQDAIKKGNQKRHILGFKKSDIQQTGISILILISLVLLVVLYLKIGWQPVIRFKNSMLQILR